MGEADGFLGKQQKETEGGWRVWSGYWPSSPKGTFPDNLLMDYTSRFYRAEPGEEKFTNVWLVTLKSILFLKKSHSQIKIWVGV